MNEKKMPKVLAIYLPQFYETEDNNKWWGKGFTDWDSVKASEKYFPTHCAPWKPLNENYYDLSDVQTMRNHAKLAKKYNIDGFCFYHYYFKDGKKELELPAENLLNNKDIDIQFCFNWANESWIRSWSKIDGNVWSEKYEGNFDKNSNGTLVLQDYGTEKEWKEHFDYLLPFFKDKRYIKIENKPVFIIYRPNSMKPIRQMADYWTRLALKEGMKGIYFIGVNTNISDMQLDASMVYEPRNAINKLNSLDKVKVNEGIRCYEYEDIWNEIINTSSYIGCKTFFSGVVGYDDTPRRGRSGECMINRTADIFQKGLERLMIKNIEYGNELVFINAWNEWGEGMYLEPDEEFKYDYLLAVKKSVENVKKGINQIQFHYDHKQQSEEIKMLIHDINKYKSFVTLLDNWLTLERDKKINFSKFFQVNNIQSIAIYGMATLGKQIYEECIREKINILYGIDQYVGQCGELKIYRPEESIPSVDAIIVTAYDIEMIADKLKTKCDAKILDIEQLLYFFAG